MDWPSRVSPGYYEAPRPDSYASTPGMVLTAPTGEQLGTLLLKLVEWIIEPIDLTSEGSVSSFQPPPGTEITPEGHQIPSNILTLISKNTTYSM